MSMAKARLRFNRHAHAPPLQVAVWHEIGYVRKALAMLLRAVCDALDAAQGTHLLEQHSSLLGAVPEVDPEAEGAPEGLSGAWGRRWLSEPATWQEVQARLLPALEAACAPLAAGSGPLQDGIFAATSLGAAACCNAPGCTNMAGLHERNLPLRTCSGCGEAKFCSRWAGCGCSIAACTCCGILGPRRPAGSVTGWNSAYFGATCGHSRPVAS